MVETARRADARRNRSALLDAAAEQRARGVRLTLAGVAAAAGLSRSTLHRHFPDREALESALREDALAEAHRVVDHAASSEGTPLSALRRLTHGIVEIARRRPDLEAALNDRAAFDRLAQALLPMVDRIRRAAEIGPKPPRRWQLRAAGHYLRSCLEAEAPETLFRALVEPLDRGLVVLDPEGSLICLNPRARRILRPNRAPEVGKPYSQPDGELLYADGPVCPPDAHPLAAAVLAREDQRGVVGHRDGHGVRWIEVDARWLRAPDGPYAVLGVLTDVTRERGWELERLRPAGQLGAARQVPLDIARVLDEIPPHLFPEQFVAEAGRLGGGPVALYVVDIDGTHLLRLAGPEEFPHRLAAPLALGPELAEDAVPALRTRLDAELPGTGMAPMWLRGRAVGLLVGLGMPDEALVELGRHGAAAMELASGYTDVFDAARRRKETHAAAELQQSLLPPRIARMGGGEIAGGVLPSYEVGGDWFDYVENRDGAWISIADAVGKGPTAGALGGIALAALRAARRSGQTLEEAALTMHEVVADVGRPEFFVTAIVARWNAVYSTFSWINCGHPPPLVLKADHTIEQLMAEPELPLGLLERERRFVRHQRRLAEGERLILHSDGITARRTEAGLFGLDGIELAVRRAQSRTAPALAQSIQDAVMEASEDPLQDDAVVLVVAPA